MSDLAFVRTWYPVAVPQYYNPVTSLLLKDKATWTGMRTAGQIRHATGRKPPVKSDSLYRPIQREVRRFNPLRVPTALQRQLPFKSKPKLRERLRGKHAISKRAVVLEPHERRALTLMQQLATLHREKARQRRQQQEAKHKAHIAQREREEKKGTQKIRELKRKFYQEVGKAQQRTKKRRIK